MTLTQTIAGNEMRALNQKPPSQVTLAQITLANSSSLPAASRERRSVAFSTISKSEHLKIPS